MSQDETTTVQVSYEVWAALDKRKNPGNSFDDVIRRLINNTAAPMGAIREDSDIEQVGVEEVENPPNGATCSYYDTIAEETCGNKATYLQTMRYGEGEPQEFYFCDEHMNDEL